jgi:cardiolipin synthase A/B
MIPTLPIDPSVQKETVLATLPEIRLVKGGVEYFVLLKDLISCAQDSIYFQTYIFEEDQIGREVADCLKAAALRGVNVFLLVDGYASADLSASFIAAFEKAGVHFRMFNPILKSDHFYFGRRLHHKVVVVDSLHALVGGINVSDRYNDMPDQPAWLDWAVYSTGEVATWLRTICEQRVTPPSKRVLRNAKNYFSSARATKFIPNKNSAVAVKINDWVRGKREITRSYLSMFRNANDRIVILSAYFLPNGQFRNALKRATSRGVKVQLIVAGVSDVPVAKNAERYMYRWLLKNGIEIFEYQKNILHGKMAVYDGKWATVGSYNVNSISAYASIELNLAIDDVPFAKQAESALKNIIEHDCVRITHDHIAHYGWTNRVLQHAAYYIFRVVFFLFTFYFKQRE